MNGISNNEMFVFISRVGGLFAGLAAPVVGFIFLQVWNDIQDLKRAVAQTNINVQVSNVQRDDIIRRLGRVEDAIYIDRKK